MTKTTNSNYLSIASPGSTFNNRISADSDTFARNDIDSLGNALDLHDHSSGKGLAVNTIPSGGLTVTSGGLTVTAGNFTLTAGNLVMGSGHIVGATTSTVFNNSADGATNLTIADGGNVTINRGSLVFAAATSIINPGATSINFNNNANNATNLTIADAGNITVGRGTLITVASASGAAGFNLPHGAAPSSPTNGDMWTTTGGAFIRINGVTKTFTLT